MLSREHLVHPLFAACLTMALACTTSSENTTGASTPTGEGNGGTGNGVTGRGASGTTSGDTGSLGSGGSQGGSSGIGSSGGESAGGSATGGHGGIDATGTGGTGAGGAAVDDGGEIARPDAALTDAGTGCTAAGTICWDFEEGKLPAGFTPYRNEFSGTLLVDGTRPHRGNYSLHAKDFSGGVEGQQGGPKHTVIFDLPANFGPVLWGRAYVYTTPARPMSHAGLFNARYPRPNATSTAITALDWYEVATYMQDYMTVWHPPEPPGYPEWVQVSNAPLTLDGWACLEWLFDGANGTNAQAADPRMWLDGAELTWPAPFVFSDPATTMRPIQEKAQNFTVLETGAYLYQGLAITTNWWIDDLAVGRQRIGCN